MIARRRHMGVTAAGVAALWLLAPALTVLHSVDGHEHYWCAEHGALEEGAERVPGETGQGEQAGVHGAVHLGDAHQSCAFAATANAQAPAAPPAARVQALAPVDFDPALSQGGPAVQIPILSVAPKASPPSLV